MEPALGLVVLWFLPIAISAIVAESHGRSAHYAWWAVALGWLGAFIAIFLILAQGDNRHAPAAGSGVGDSRSVLP